MTILKKTETAAQNQETTMNYLLVEIPHQRNATVTEMTEAEIIVYAESELARDGESREELAENLGLTLVDGDIVFQTLDDAVNYLGRDLQACHAIPLAEAGSWARAYTGHQAARVLAAVVAIYEEFDNTRAFDSTGNPLGDDANSETIHHYLQIYPDGRAQLYDTNSCAEEVGGYLRSYETEAEALANIPNYLLAD